MNLTPEQLREKADEIEGGMFTVLLAGEQIELLRAHASALERLAERDAELKETQECLDEQSRHAAELDAELARLKGHAEVMGRWMDIYADNEAGKIIAAAYRADYPEK